MTVEDEYIGLFRAHVIHKNNIDDIELTIYSNGIQHIKIPRYSKVSYATTRKVEKLMEGIGGKYHTIFEFASFSDIDPEVRDWAAAETGNNYTFTDAIVIESLPQKILADFYLRFNKPAKPTRFFYSLEKAAKWTFEQMNTSHAPPLK